MTQRFSLLWVYTSYCETNKNLIKDSLIFEGGHLAAVFGCVSSRCVEDQNVGRLSELSSVLQVPFFFQRKKEKNKTLQLLIDKQSMTRKFKNKVWCQVLYMCHSSSWVLCWETFLWNVESCWMVSILMTFSEVYLIFCSESRHNWGCHSLSSSILSGGCL